MNELTHTSEPLLAAEEEFQNPEQGSQTAQLPDDKALPPVIREAVEIRMKYAGYIERQQRQVAELSAKISSEGGPVTMRTLAVNGKKLRDAGFPEGKPMGLLLSALLEAVTADPTLNNEQTLLALAADIYGKVGTDTTAKKK